MIFIKTKQVLSIVVLVVCAFLVHTAVVADEFNSAGKSAQNLFVQTDVNRAEHVVDDAGVPYLVIQGVGRQRHPAWVALYALAYSGVEIYEAKLVNLENEKKFDACIKWLEKNLKQQPNGLWLWFYNFNNTYNDVSIKAPWSSAFAQATGIQAFIVAYRRTGNTKYLELATKAAKPLYTPINKGGLLFQNNTDVWFEEIPLPSDNPSHILNGHMRALLALKELFDITADKSIEDWVKRGSDTLYRWLPLYDTGYWLRYDLNPKKEELLFRIANPYGFTGHKLAIDKIVLRDPLNHQHIASIDIGTESDADGANRIAGNDWGAKDELNGRRIRRLFSASIKDNAVDTEIVSHNYFYLTLPDEWENNLRNQWYELVINYYDDVPANLGVQMRSIAPGKEFHDMRDADLLLTGAKEWRSWVIPVRPNDLGFWVGELYAKKHWQYLEKISNWDERFVSWMKIAKGYYYLATELTEGLVEVTPDPVILPKQTPMVPIYSLDSQGVVMQHLGNNQTRWKSDGTFDPSGSKGTPVYSPFIISEQLRFGENITGAAYSEIDRSKISKLPALHWLLDPMNYRSVGNASIYTYSFPNSYNDVSTKEGWASAFGQAYVLKSLFSALEYKIDKKDIVYDAIEATAKGFSVSVEKGGIQSQNNMGLPWYEEVPNSTHVLNAHLVSIPTLYEASRLRESSIVTHLLQDGIKSLKEKLYLFDTGYWLRYDLNPKKEILLQLDWISGTLSPEIDEIRLINPQTGHYVRLDVADDQDDFKSTARISGDGWQPAVRSFINGYKIHEQSVRGGTRHNVYVNLPLPDKDFEDFFDVPAHKLLIRYKDIAEGKFNIKIRSINEGNKLEFIPLRDGLWSTQGDQQWKDVAFIIRPQDLGWYKGRDYQQYEIKQLQEIANITNDWFFEQYVIRQKEYLHAYDNELSVIHTKSDSVDLKPINLSVIESSDTYPGYGFENSIDGDPYNDYSAGIEGKPGYVILKLGRTANLSALRLHWENEVNIARNVIVSLPKADNTPGKLLSEQKALNNKISYIPLIDANNVNAIRIDFSNYSGQPRVLLRQIELIEKANSNADYSNVRIDNAAPYLTSHDKNNPLHIFRVPVTQNIKQLSDELSVGYPSAHEKILAFMHYINQFEVGHASSASPDVTVRERIGSCGTYTGTLLALAAAQGIPGRYVNLMNFPKEMGHTVAELYINGKWHLYDPTYGGYYILNTSDTSLPLSLDEIVTTYKKNPDLIYKIISKDRSGIEKFTGKNIFLDARPLGVIGLDKPMIFPLSLDVNQLPILENSSFGLKYQGADYLGAASVNQNHEWNLTGLKKGELYMFVLTPDHLGGELRSDSERTFKIKAELAGGKIVSNTNHAFDFSSGMANSWHLYFIADAPQVRLKLTHPYRGPQIYYMKVKRYSLAKIEKVSK